MHLPVSAERFYHFKVALTVPVGAARCHMSKFFCKLPAAVV
nr:MAG TPA: hypothetical protein [Caudoviricetes sp.]